MNVCTYMGTQDTLDTDVILDTKRAHETSGIGFRIIFMYNSDSNMLHPKLKGVIAVLLGGLKVMHCNLRQ